MTSDVTNEVEPASTVGASSGMSTGSSPKATGAQAQPSGAEGEPPRGRRGRRRPQAAAAYARGRSPPQRSSPHPTTARRSSWTEATWVAANVETFAAVMDPVVATMDRATGPALRAVGAKVSAAEAGALLAFLSSKVLGRPRPPGSPRLMLVAPNIVEAERELGVDPDFRRWVAMHEETHRVHGSPPCPGCVAPPRPHGGPHRVDRALARRS